jgi:hypothetical protein
MLLNIAAAFENAKTGVSIWRSGDKYQVRVRNSDGSFSVAIAATPQEAYQSALREVEAEDLL